MKQKLRFEALIARQSPTHQVVMIRATAADIQRIASIARLARDEEGQALGFQRPQVASHIAEIRDYLESSTAVLPNALVLAFVDGARVVRPRDGQAVLEVAVDGPARGLVVDGQQRLTALLQAGRQDFEVFASVLICKNEDELRRQFILINNTRPLPKSLIYELIPAVADLPPRLRARSVAATLTASLNFDRSSSLHRQIRMQTNPAGVIKDTAIQKAILNSQSAGAVQSVLDRSDGLRDARDIVSNFFGAVQQVFADAWIDRKPTDSRLVHGAGVVAMGYVMDEIYAKHDDPSVDAFVDGLKPLRGMTAWTEGHWHFGLNEVVAWNRIENTSRQIQQLSEHLVGLVRRGPGRRASSRSQ